MHTFVYQSAFCYCRYFFFFLFKTQTRLFARDLEVAHTITNSPGPDVERKIVFKGRLPTILSISVKRK